MARPRVRRNTIDRMWRVFTSLAALVIAVSSSAETAVPMPVSDPGPAFYAAPAEPGAKPTRLDTARTAILSQRIRLDLHAVTIPVALAAIGQQSGLRFTYDRTLLRTGARVTLSSDAITVASALTHVLRGVPVDVDLAADGLASIVSHRARDGGTITGRVSDSKTGQGIPRATLLLEGIARGATTNDSGVYRITNVPTGTYTLDVRFLGYVESRQAVTIASTQQVVVNVALVQSVKELDQVVVAGTVTPTEVKAVPTPVSVITASDIDLQRPQSVVQLFREVVPSAVSWDFATNPEQTTMSVRGGSTLNIGSGSLKVYLDGIEITDETVAAIDPASIDRIEVIRGPQAATIYGSGAISGVMLVTTKHGTGDLSRPTVSLQVADGVIQSPYAHQGGGDAARQEYTASITGGSANAGYNLGGGYTSTGNWVAQGGTAVPSVYGGAHLQQGALSIDVSGRDFVQHDGVPFPPDFASTGLSSFAKPNNDASANEEQSYGASLVYTPTNWWRHNLTIGSDRFTDDLRTTGPVLTSPADTFLVFVEENENKTTVAYNSSFQIPVSRIFSSTLTVGADHYNLDDQIYFTGLATNTTGTIGTNPAAPVTASRSPTTNTGIFAQAQVDISERLFLTAGVRGERNSAFGQALGTPVLPRFGGSYATPIGQATLKVRASYGAAIRPPVALEQDALTGPAATQLANPELRPERQSGWDTGFDLAFGARASVSATYYNQYANDLIDGVTIDADTVPQVQQFQNIGTVHNTGLELQGSLRLPFGQLSAQYAVANSRVDALGPEYGGDLQIGDQLLGIPHRTGGATLSVRPLRSTTVVLGVAYVGSWTNYDDLAEDDCFSGKAPCFATTRGYWHRYPAFTKANLSITQQITTALAGFVSVTNLTNNEDYELLNSVPIIGRITVVGIRFRY
jgi:outer membrane receptor protein involved in Fe transport